MTSSLFLDFKYSTLTLLPLFSSVPVGDTMTRAYLYPGMLIDLGVNGEKTILLEKRPLIGFSTGLLVRLVVVLTVLI